MKRPRHRPARRPGTWDALLRQVATETGVSLAQTNRIVDRLLDLVRGATWTEGRLVVPGFAVFRVRTAKARSLKNPSTGEPMRLPETRVVTARASAAWRRQ